jgi:plastocyanin
MSDTIVVRIVNFSFLPAQVEILTNQNVIWENGDMMEHTATRVAAPAFDTGAILPGGRSATVVFAAVTPVEGVEYFCKPHPFMRGRIVVRAEELWSDAEQAF